MLDEPVDTSVLATKLYIPTPRPGLITRRRLIERLNEGLLRRLTILSAPAGFGKTTLVSSWLHDVGFIKPDPSAAPSSDFDPASEQESPNQIRVAWLSLDEADNELERFLSYFILALQQIEPETGLTAQGMLEVPQLARVENLLTALVNEITGLPGESVLVLDDYHVIDNQAIHEAMDYLIKYLPHQLHLIIASRSQLPLSLSRLRSQAQLLEITSADLRFTAVEVEKFLNETMHLDLLPADRIALEMRTEGWVAGLQLAGISLQAWEDTSAFIANLTGSDHYIGDYLFEEVLQRQPNEIHQFLLYTSVTDSLCGSLCDALLANSGGQEILERLDNLRLFIVPLDNRRQWYRYHRLFLELLRHRLMNTYPDQIPVLHQRASIWFEEHKQLEDAIQHGIKAQDFERTADLIETVFQQSWVHRDLRRLLEWFEALPKTVTRSRPKLELGYAWLLFEVFSDQWDRIESHLRHVKDWLSSPGAKGTLSEYDVNRMLAEVDLLQANHARQSGEPKRVIALCQKAIDRLPDDERYLRSGILAHLASAYESLGSMDPAQKLYTESIRQCRLANNVDGLMFAAAGLIEVLVISGQLHQAEIIFAQVSEFVEKRSGPDMGRVYISMSEVYRELNRLDIAKTYLEQGLDLCRPFEAWHASVIAGVISMARVLAVEGHIDRAMDALLEIEKHPSSTDPRERARLASIRSRLSLLQGDLKAAVHWANHSGLSVTAEVEYSQENEYLTLVRVLIAQGNLDEAMSLMDRLHQTAVSGDRIGRVIEIQLLQALAYQAQDDIAQALKVLEQALSLAESEGYSRIFLDEGESMAQLLRNAGSQDISPGYVSKLLAAYNEEEAQRRQSTSSALLLYTTPQPILDPLTERELETLKLLATDLSIPEIADELVVAVSTLRTHIKHIYSKLNVHSRIEAIHRAEDLNLL